VAPVIRRLGDKHYDAWDKFVTAAPHGTFFHLAGWRDVIENAFRHTSHYIFAEQDGAITGVLPLVYLRSVFFGRKLVSVPFCVYGGPIATDDATAHILAENAIDLMKHYRADLIEFRTREAGCWDWATRPGLYATFRKPISSEPDANLKAIPRKQRAVVRKAVANRLLSNTDHNVNHFFAIYSESVRNLGTPVFSRRYFDLLIDKFRDFSEILTVSEDGKPISAVLSFFFRHEVLPYYGGGRPRAREVGAFDFMYWEVMNRAAQTRQARLFDFGRSKMDTGSFSFKKNWGFDPQPLHYSYWLRPGCVIPEHNPLNPKYRLMIEAWKRLPLPVANWIGPTIVKGIG
jgi:FemAB-related protein (PEP-CTERM system-associated)